MGLFNRKKVEKEIKTPSEKKNLNLNKVDKNDLMNVAGGLEVTYGEAEDNFNKWDNQKNI